MDSIIYQFKKLRTPSRADRIVKLVHLNNELLLQKVLGTRVNDPVHNPQSEHPNTGIMNDMTFKVRKKYVFKRPLGLK